MDVLACGTGTCALSSSVWVWVWVRVHAWQRMSHSTETTVAAAWLRAGHACLSTCVDKGARRHTGHSGTRMDGSACARLPARWFSAISSCVSPQKWSRKGGRAGGQGRAGEEGGSGLVRVHDACGKSKSKVCKRAQLSVQRRICRPGRTGRCRADGPAQQRTPATF